MHVKAKLHLSYGNKETAENIQRALTIDDASFVQSKIKNNEIQATIQSSSLSSFIQTIDDYLSCLSVAENLIMKDTNEKIKQKTK